VRDLAVLHEFKIGVPTMGGILIFLSTLASLVIWVSFNDLVLTILIVYTVCSLLGALDDILKITKGHSTGLTSWQKLFLQALITGMVLWLSKDNPPVGSLLLNVKWKWFHAIFNQQWAFVVLSIFYFFVISGTSNAVNLTDGIDGLAVVNVLMCLIFFGIVAFFSCDGSMINRSLLTYIAGSGEVAVMCSCFVGSCLAFFIFNCHPAIVFMGDVGAIGLGGLLAITASVLRQQFALIFVGVIFITEVLSVMLQMTSKKFFKKKIFLMSPIHHHFELKGYSERGILKSALAIQLVFIFATLLVVFYGHLGFD
jgi:phospho-N-acetylmuramoyl-pentapeptide-transferase